MAQTPSPSFDFPARPAAIRRSLPTTAEIASATAVLMIPLGAVLSGLWMLSWLYGCYALIRWIV